jgi:uncharacterized protein YecE (DUF72 family)
MAISIGIGSWTDAEYKGLLYPKGLPDKERLTTYATWFTHVEVNSSYHALPPRKNVETWCAQTPADFIFDFKLHKAFSEDPVGAAGDAGRVASFLEVARPLIEARKLGAFFLVLPPSFGPEGHRLEELSALAEKLRPHPLAVELRNNGWVDGQRHTSTLDFFRAQELSWIAVDMPRVAGSTIMPPLDEVTNPRLAYLRLHGRRPDWFKLKKAEERHTYAYPENELIEIADRARALAKKAETVHVVANNHAEVFAPKTALALQKLLGLTRRQRETTDELFPGV